MDDKPFSISTKEPESIASRRRSTRIDFVTTVLLSGKDAAGTPFREFTQTSTVNLHGCKVRTSYRIMVGMIVNVECPKAGTSGKGVCIRVWDPPPGVAGHEIAVQLIKPQNLWGVPNPPPDWEVVAKQMVQGRAVQTETPLPRASPTAPRTPTPAAVPRGPASPPVVAPAAPPAAAPARPGSSGVFRAPVIPPAAEPGGPPAAAPARLGSSGVFRGPVIPPAAEPGGPPAAAPARRSSTGAFRAPVNPPAVAAPVRPAPEAGPTVDQRLAELERRATQLVESVLDIMRGQAEELTRNILEEFRQQVEALLQDADVRLRQGFQQAYEESAVSLVALRTDLMEQMASRASQMIRTGEDTLRTRLRNRLTMEEKTGPAEPPEEIGEK